MGGFGSGGKAGQDGRKTTEDLPALDVRVLRREGLIAAGEERLEGVGRLVWTGCGLGGSRPWFVCPGSGCSRRAAILYLEGDRLLCRSCLDLPYPSQREGRLGRARRRASKARARLGPGGPATRPKGMHRSTFARLSREYLDAHQEHVALYNERFAKLMERPSERNFRLIRQMERERIEHAP